MDIFYKDECFIPEALTDREQWFKNNFLLGILRDDELEKYPAPYKMGEQEFFDRPYDVSVVRHERYAPPFFHEHEFIEMIYVFQGHCTNEIAGKKVEMSLGDVCLIAPGARHALEVFDDETIVLNYLIRTSTFENSFFSILSSGSILADFFRNIFYGEGGNAYLLFSTGQDPELRYYLARICQESQKTGTDKNNMMNTLLTLFFLTLMRGHRDHVILPETDGDDDVHPVRLLEYMQENFQTASLKEMAGHFHYSERHMKRMIVKYTGRSFSENILRIRMSQAAELLERTRLSVEAVALRVGYGEPSGFRQAFRKFYGKTPSQFRLEQ